MLSNQRHFILKCHGEFTAEEVYTGCALEHGAVEPIGMFLSEIEACDELNRYQSQVIKTAKEKNGRRIYDITEYALRTVYEDEDGYTIKSSDRALSSELPDLLAEEIYGKCQDSHGGWIFAKVEQLMARAEMTEEYQQMMLLAITMEQSISDSESEVDAISPIDAEVMSSLYSRTRAWWVLDEFAKKLMAAKVEADFYTVIKACVHMAARKLNVRYWLDEEGDPK